jgi:aminoglycoside phosphotransferase family enzyme
MSVEVIPQATPRPRGAREIAEDGIGIEDEVSFLGSAAAYPDRPASIERIETHFSWVFLAERYVFKLKKPVRADGIDFSSLASRRRNAEAEVRLNRRLAADVYLGIEPLTCLPGRGFSIGGEGRIVDWLVKMVRLPADHMLDRRIASGNLLAGDIEGLASRLAAFFAAARHVHVPPRAYSNRFRAECRLTLRAFAAYGTSQQQVKALRIARAVGAFVARTEPMLLQRRVRLVEGHGDLRPEHVCIGSTARVIDCLEFRWDLRSLDPVDELAFLAMECERLGAAGIERVLFRHYSRRTRDAPPSVLVRFYKAIGALIRARIAILHLRDASIRDPTRWTQRADDYLAIASRHTARLRR